VIGERTDGGRLRCPYHGWTYALDGALTAVPGEELFAGFQKSSCGLPEVACAVWAGWIWLNFANDPPPLDEWLAGMGDEVENYAPADQVIHARRQNDVALNWKAALDAFNEVYHVPFIHRASVGRLVSPRESDFRYYGVHSRMSVPVRQTLAEADGRRATGPDVARLPSRTGKQLLPEQQDGHVNYLFFPCTIGDLTATWGIWFRFEPLSVQHTRITAEMLTDPPASDRQRASFDRHWAELSKVLDEDYAAMGMIGQGMRSEGFQVARFGGAEERLIRFHEEVQAIVETSTP
jgi:phenylpropionate dioxygenase-like ring-hydroxylating dioxygenase large terminal subunit